MQKGPETAGADAVVSVLGTLPRPRTGGVAPPVLTRVTLAGPATEAETHSSDPEVPPLVGEGGTGLSPLSPPSPVPGLWVEWTSGLTSPSGPPLPPPPSATSTPVLLWGLYPSGG